MAKRLGIKYTCSNCGASFGTWTGRCQNCGQWNTLQEQVEVTTASLGRSGNRLKTQSATAAANDKIERVVSTIKDVDEVLGGGFVPGSVLLVAGEPGIGKSTLLLQIAYSVARKHRVLYVSGEE